MTLRAPLAVLAVALLGLCCPAAGSAPGTRLLRRLAESIPAGESAYDAYTASWIRTHETWFAVTHEDIPCEGGVHFPVCVDGHSLESDAGAYSALCPAYTCSAEWSSGHCTPTPQDTLDFVAPTPTNSLDATEMICPVPGVLDKQDVLPPFYGFDTGVPPLFSEVQYAALSLSGTVRAQQGTACAQVPGAAVEIWHVNPNGFDLSSFNGGAREEGSQHDTSQLLRTQSCRGAHTTGADGAYSFDTSVPPSYGPPRHINVMVSAPGYQTLVTRVYFSDDFRLRQLTVLHGEEGTMFVDGLSGRDYNHGFAHNTRRPDEVGNRDGDERYQNIFPGNIGRDPRVVDVFIDYGEETGQPTGQPTEQSGGQPTGQPTGQPSPQPSEYSQQPSLPPSQRMTASFDIFLKPLRPIDSLTPDSGDTSQAAADARTAAGLPPVPAPPLDLNGLWSDELGGLVTVETVGSLFMAAEYPHPRRWGTVFGALSGDSVRGVDFRGLSHTDAILRELLQRRMQRGADGEVRPVLDSLGQQLLWQEGDTTISRPSDSVIDPESTPTVGMDVAEAAEIAKALRGFALSSLGAGGRGGGDTTAGTDGRLWSTALSTGVVSWIDPFNTDVDEARIEWSGGVSETGMKQYWSKYTKSKTFRYLKVLITRETGGYDGGRLEINEIKFFEGILAQSEYPRPDMKMQSPRTPAPQLVTCSSFTEQRTHCYRAFDGDASGGSAWQTVPVGSDRKSLTPAQWVTLDFGAGQGIRPTSVRIVCGASDVSDARGCPMTFALMGSDDNVRFSTLLSVDMYDYISGYSAPPPDPESDAAAEGSLTGGGLTFDLFWESPQGRENGHRCGSCDTGPDFACSTGAFDSTCASRYCGVGGYCEKIPACPAGWYLASSAPAAEGFTAGGEESRALGERDRVSVSCAPCPPGSFGDRPGLVHSNCSGLCDAGYYCTGASPTPRQHACGRADVYCPAGTGPHPLSIGAGEKCLGSALDPVVAGLERRCAETALCAPGHYCANGVERQCPAGRFGASAGLQSAECTGLCLPGEYCPPASAQPTVCPKGHYCSQGHIRSPCPAGRYGARTGIEDEACSGLCRPGYFCPEGSVSKTEVQCPAGRFGAIAGLPDASCSGPCHAGYYCPLASTAEEGLVCGGTGVFCPEASPLPVQVSRGYYSVGSTVPADADTRTGQAQCEAGFYCVLSDYPQPGGVHLDVRGGTRHPCPPGSYGADKGLLSTTRPREGHEFDVAADSDYICSGLCERGFYCPLNSTSARQAPCPAGRYGAAAGLADDACSAVCPMGHYCPLGSYAPVPCPSGKLSRA
jgi:protocatechuate 3,4-dioxygenase beta subunit